MSHETDNSSSGPQGAYPSGTPPYGPPAEGTVGGEGTDASRQAVGDPPKAGETTAQERKTETQLTTRIRINIPGSRPIPPVVMRTPMSDLNGPEAAAARKADTPSTGEGDGTSGSAAGSSGDTTTGQASTPSTETERTTSDWFAPPPRKSSAARRAAGAGGPAGAGEPTAPKGIGETGTAFGTGHVPGATEAGARPTGGAAGQGFDTGGHTRPDTGASSSFGSDKPASTGPATGSTTAAGLPRRPTDHASGRPGAGARREPVDLFGNDRSTDATTGAPPPPSGPVAPGGVPAPSVPGADGGLFDGPPGGPGVPFDGPGASPTRPMGADGGPRESDLAFFSQDVQPNPAGPTGGPVTGDSTLEPRPGGAPRVGGPSLGNVPPHDDPVAGPPRRMSDDTAELTPQSAAPEPVRAPEEHISGHTVTSGIPVVPTHRSSPFAPSGPLPEPGDSALTHTPPKLPEPSSPAAGAEPPARKGRSKLVLPLVALAVAAGGLYGAGLLVNHSDVPKGTTVLGVDIGGGTRDDAAKKLDAALGRRVHQTLPLSVNGKTVALKPDQAGLSLDTAGTVQNAAASDYNPVTVVGALFGGTRAVEPVMPVDEEKLHAALKRIAGGAGTATEGTIEFKPGRAIPVYGKTGKSIDADRSTTAVAQGYRTMVEQGNVNPVRLPLTERRPTISRAEVDRMMREFARPAMSGIVTIRAGDRSIPFGPEKSLPQILGVQAVDGKLVDTYDRAAVKRLYGNVFDGVLVTRANGKKTPVQPEDVIGVLRKALLGRTPQERVGTIDLNPG